MRNFYRSRDEFCGNKFSSHQVNASDFFRAVDECTRRYPMDRAVPAPRVVLLTTFREPIQMTLSQVSSRVWRFGGYSCIIAVVANCAKRTKDASHGSF